MAKRIPENELKAILEIVRGSPEGITAQQIEQRLSTPQSRRTLQHRVKSLVRSNLLIMEGDRRWARYRIAALVEPSASTVAEDAGKSLRLSREAKEIQKSVRQPAAARRPVGYRADFLESYRPNLDFYLSPDDRKRLREIGSPALATQPAGTYAKNILNRLLIDLSWNSSRLEGNTYSLLDTKRLIDFGQEAEGKGRLEAQMILNHKDAIEFLVGSADEVGFNRHTILNLHALLANNLLSDPDAVGRLRHIAVGIERSVFHPLEVPQRIEQYFDQVLATASAIADPFEQAFFVMVQLPYLQPFDDVNKRVSRLAANIPFIKANLSPLSFEGMPRDLYTDATLGIYELNRVELLREVFIWAYERSAARYVAVRQSLGEPDPFRLRYRTALRDLVREVILGPMDRKQAIAQVMQWVEKHVATSDRERFREVAETELLSLHLGNFARYQIKPSEFAAWQEAWKR